MCCMNITHKICKTCQISKSLDNFKKETRCKSGITPHCKECINKKKKKYRYNNHLHVLEIEKIRRDNPKIKQYYKDWWIENCDSQSEKARKRYKENPNPYLQRAKKQRLKDPLKYKSYLKKWRNDNKKYLNEQMNHRLRTDVQFKLRHNLSNSLRKAIKLQGGHKKGSILKYTGCNMSFLRGYLESKFVRGMTWENHGKVWHIDHVIPRTSFNLLDENEVHKCCHYTNLQPLFVIDNLLKGNKIQDGTLAKNIN